MIESDRYRAIQILSVASCASPAMTLRETADALGIESTNPVLLARRTLARTLGDDGMNWREARAEAAQRLRETR